MTESGLFQQTAGLPDMIVPNEQASRQDPDRAFEHAHVLVEQHIRNLRAIQQRLDGGNQDGIVGADKLAQASSPVLMAIGTLGVGRAVLQVGNQLNLPAAARDRVENEPGNN